MKTALEALSASEKKEVWHAFRKKYPNWAWSVVFLALWVLWFTAFTLFAQYLSLGSDSFSTRILLHLGLTLGIGVIGGIMVVGILMLPKRRRDFAEYLDGKTLPQIKADLNKN